MVAFTDRLIEANRAIWAAMAGHTFVLGLARGTWPVCLGYLSNLRCAAFDGAMEGLTALYAAERAYLDTWTAVAERSPADPAYHAWIQNWSGEAWPA